MSYAAGRHTRENSGIKLDRSLRWWHDGRPIEHPRIVEAFNLGLSPTDDGRYRLDFGHDWCLVEVEDAAYAVLSVEPSRHGLPTLGLSDRTSEVLEVGSLALEADVLTCKVKAGRAKARFGRDAQFQLGSLFEEREGRLLLRAGQRLVAVPFFPS